MTKSCEDHSKPGCLLSQLASGTAKTTATECEECRCTIDDLNVDLMPLAGLRQESERAREGGYHRAGQLARGVLDDKPKSTPDESADSSLGLHVRCRHCGARVELNEHQGMSQIDCANCGQTFRMIDVGETHEYDAKGRTIGHFKLIEQVGSGSFGVVWRAEDTELDRTVAIKIPRSQQLSNREIDRFIHEARASASLNHPNIVSVHEIGREDDAVFIVSDYVDGLTLADYLTGKIITAQEAAQLCATICDALQHAHDQSVVHRDLKPSNIGIDRHLHPHIMDFGLALRGSTELTMTTDGKIMGTPAYMSPEQARGDSQAADGRSDIYSVGVMLFEMLTNERPFRGNLRMLLHQILHDEPPNPQRLNGAIPRDLATICLKCLEKSPDRRYQSAEDLQLELQRFLDGRPIEARPVSAVEQGWRWCKRNRMTAALTSLLLVSLVVGTAVSSWKWIEASANARLADSEKANAERTATEMQQQSSELLFERGQRLCNSGEIAEGLNWMGASLRTLPTIESSDPWRKLIRSNLSAWHSVTPRLRHRLELPESLVAVACSPTEDMLVTGGTKGIIRRFDTLTGELLGVTEAEEVYEDAFAVQAIEFHPSGDHFLVARGTITGEKYRGTLTRVNARTGERERTLLQVPGPLLRMSYNEDATLIAVAGMPSRKQRGYLWILDAEDGELIGETTHLDFVPNSVEFEPSSDAIIVGSERQLYRVEVASRQIELIEIRREPSAAPVELATGLVSWLPGTDRIFLPTADGRSGCWQYPAMQPVGPALEHASVIASVAAHPLAPVMMVSDWSGLTQIVDVHINQLAEIQVQTIGRTCWNRSGDQFVSFFKRRVEIWDMPRAGIRATDPNSVDSTGQFQITRSSIAPNGKVACVAGQDGIARLLNPNTGATVGPPLHHPFPDIRATAFSPDGRLVATSCCATGNVACDVRIWDASTGAPVSDSLPQRNWVSALQFSRDGESLAAVNYSAEITILSVAELLDGKPAETAFLKCSDVLLSVGFSPDGSRIVAGSADSHTGQSTALLWDVQSQTRIGRPMEHGGWVNWLRFSPDGKQVLTGSTDGFARLWDAETTNQIGTPMPYSSGKGLAIYSPDGQFVLTGGINGVVQLWNSKDCQPVNNSSLKWPGEAVSSLAFSSDGRRFLVGFVSGRCQLCERTPFATVGPSRILRSSALAIQFAMEEEGFVVATDVIARICHLSGLQEATFDDEALVNRIELDTGVRCEPVSHSAVDISWTEWLKRKRVGTEPKGMFEHPMHLLDERLVEAFEDGDPRAIRGYVELLLNVEPANTNWKKWQLHACRADVAASHGSFTAAEEAYSAAENSLKGATEGGLRLATRNQRLLDWQRQQATVAIKVGDWQLARWYLDRILTETIDDWTLLRDRAAVLSELGESALRSEDLNRALGLEPDSGFLVMVARERAQEGEWTSAADLFDRAHKEQFASDAAMQEHFVASLMADRDRASSLITKAITYAKSGRLTLVMAQSITRYAGIIGPSEGDAADLLELSDRVIRTQERLSPARKGHALQSHAWLLIRLSKLDEAVETFEESTRLVNSETQLNLLGRSLAWAQNGEVIKAQSYFDKLQPEAYRKEQSFWNQQVWDTLLDEVVSLGVTHPASPASSSHIE